jgi:AAA15 family ATPase/GTPase
MHRTVTTVNTFQTNNIKNMKGIGFENFRVFADKAQFDLAPVTVLTGANSSGKSTIIKGLKLMQNFWQQTDNGYSLKFGEGDHQLGTFDMCLSKYSDNSTIKFTYQTEHEYFLNLHDFVFGKLYIELEFADNKPLNGIIKGLKVMTQDSKVLIAIKKDGKLHSYNYNYKNNNQNSTKFMQEISRMG